MDDRQVALLRGINVGKGKRVPMAELRALCVELGWRDVRTLLNSGNVAYRAPGVAPAAAQAALEAGILGRFGFSVRVVVLGAAELTELLAENPFGELATDPSRLLVAVLADPADRPRLEALVAEVASPDPVALGRRAAYLWCARGILETPLAEALLTRLGERVTTRNLATLGKLEALVAGL